MKLLILVSLTVIFVASIAILLAITIDIDENNVQNISQTKITDVIPNTVFGGEASWRTTNIAVVKDDVVYTIEGTILEFGSPIEYVDSRNRASGAIPVTMSIEQVHKGNLSTQTFTFFLHSWVTLNPSQISEVDNNQDFVEEHRKMYVGQDYSNVEKQYKIIAYPSLFEIGDKVIAHIEISDFGEINYIYKKDQGTLDPYYSISLGPYGYYEIQDSLGFNEKYPNGIAINNIISESLPSPISENEIIPHRYFSGEDWAIEYEYEYAETSFPIEQVEKIISENTISNEKFKILNIETVSDYENRFGESPFATPLQNTDINFTHVIRIGGLWTNHHDLIQETLENIQGIKNVGKISIWEN